MQAKVAYIAQGTPEAQKATKEAFDRGAVTGYLLDATLRVMMEMTGDLDTRFPASQLTFEEAMRRIKENPQMLPIDLQGEPEPTPEVVVKLFREAKLVLKVTRPGGCILPAEEGPCPAGDDCPIGCDPERNQDDPTCGCRWGVRVGRDDAVEAYQADVEVMKAQRDAFAEEPGYEQWVTDSDRRIKIWQAQLGVVLGLREKLST